MVHYIIPLYNKSADIIENIKTLNLFLKNHLNGEYEIILCDDGSTDDTLALANKCKDSIACVRVVGYKENKGRGHAVKFAGNNCRGDYIIYIDLDFSKTTKLDKLIEMIEYLHDNDIVIGSRFLPDSDIKRFPFRRFVSSVYRCLVKLILPELKINDIDVGFKGFRTACFKEINSFSKFERWSWDLEFLTIARLKGMKIKEFPIDWNERYDGYASVVHIFKDSFEELCGIVSMRLRSLRFRNKLRI